MTPTEVADYLIRKLNKEGFLIQRYDARSTNSIYLKLDYGVAKSIRISDHKGFENLHYTFNVECGREEDDISIEDGTLRYYYAPNEQSLDNLVAEAVKVKSELWKRLGGKKYTQRMNHNLREGMNQDYYKFWHRAKLV